MAGSAIAIADKVVLAIDAKTDYSNSLDPTTTRKLAPNTDAKGVEDVTDLIVMVTPTGLLATIQTQGEVVEDYQVRVTVRGRIENDDDSNDIDETEINKFLTFVSELQTQVVTYSDSETNDLVVLQPYTNDPLYDSGILENGVFYSVTEFTFRDYKGV